MRIPVLAVLVAAFAGTASAGDAVYARDYESNDYAAQVYYRVDFGTTTRQAAQSVGLRLDHENARAHGAPAVIQASYGEQGIEKVALTGVDMYRMIVSSQQSGGGGLTVGQWVGIGVTALVFGGIALETADSEDDPAVGTGAQ